MKVESHVGHSDPTPVSAIEYVFGVIRAYQVAGLTVDHRHIMAVQQKLMDESSIPKFRLLRVMDKLNQAIGSDKETVEVSIEDLRTILKVKGVITESN